MGDYRIPGEKLTAFGDETRRLARVEGGLTYDQMLELLGGLESTNTLTAAENSAFGNVEAEFEHGILDCIWQLDTDNHNETMGYEFIANEDMTVHGMWVRAGETYTFDDTVASLWDINGNLLASCRVAQDANGAQGLFDSPVNLKAGNSYVTAAYVFESRRTRSTQCISNPRITLVQGRLGAGDYTTPQFPTRIAGVDSIYFADILIGESATPRPSVYTVQLETMDDIADEVIRITGASTVQTPAQIISALQNEEPGGGGALQAKTATPTGEIQEVTADAGFYGLSKVTVGAAKLQQKTVTPTTQAQEVTANSGYYGLSKVVVEAVEVKEIKLQEKTLTPTKNTQSATPDNGYDGLSKVNVGAIPDEYIVPSGTKNIAANGNHDVITYESVSVNVPIPDGYIQPSGTLSITQNGEYDVTEKAGVLVSVDAPEPTLQAKTVTPTTAEQIVKPDSGYDGLSQVGVAAIPGSYVQPTGTKNITENGTHDVTNYAAVEVEVAGSGGGGGNLAEAIARTATEINDNTVTSIGDYTFCSYFTLKTASFQACTTIGIRAFVACSSLTTANFPACTSVGSSAFQNCSSLTTASFPACTYIGVSAFSGCNSLTTANFPACTSVDMYAFLSCRSLTTASLPACTYIGSYAFQRCYNLKSLYLTGSSVCRLYTTNAFASTPIGGYSTSAGTYGSIYVPASLLTAYQSASYWSSFSSRFVGV